MALLLRQRVLQPSTLIALRRLYSDKVLTLEVDSIDAFTSQLMQEKHIKWDSLKPQKPSTDNSYNLLKPKYLNVQLTSLSEESLRGIFNNVIDDWSETTARYLIKQCCETQVCPDIKQLISVLDNYCHSGDVEMVESIKNLVKQNDYDSYTINSNFDHYLAEAIWLKGDVLKALQLFEDVYRKNVYLRRRIRLMLKYLILDVTKQSEAVLVNIIKFSENILKDFKDHYPLTCVWQACFVSEWFNDQMLALELLEKHDGLCKAISTNIHYVVGVSLRAHQTDVVYRLLEVLLKYDLKMQYSVVLVALFEYRFRQGDLRSCSEIIRWSVSNEVLLPSTLHQRFLMLLLKRPNTDNVVSREVPKKFPLKF